MSANQICQQGDHIYLLLEAIATTEAPGFRSLSVCAQVCQTWARQVARNPTVEKQFAEIPFAINIWHTYFSQATTKLGFLGLLMQHCKFVASYKIPPNFLPNMLGVALTSCPKSDSPDFVLACMFPTRELFTRALKTAQHLQNQQYTVMSQTKMFMARNGSEALRVHAAEFLTYLDLHMYNLLCAAVHAQEFQVVWIPAMTSSYKIDVRTTALKFSQTQ